MVKGSSVKATALAIVAVGIGGATLSGCAPPTPTSLNQRLDQEGATPGTVTPGMVRPNGTLSNGLLPEPWGDTN
jgi:hypothetical protein